jgi:hypothetical protein
MSNRHARRDIETEPANERASRPLVVPYDPYSRPAPTNQDQAIAGTRSEAELLVFDPHFPKLARRAV